MPKNRYNIEVETKRLDQHLVKMELYESRTKAQAGINAGLVSVDGVVAHKASQKVDDGNRVEVAAFPEFVSRAGYKLKDALNRFKVNPAGRICADVGASTGGFTDCLLQRGAQRVYALDVGSDLLHPTIAKNPKVISIEKTNVREINTLPEPVSLVVIDVSFISLDRILPVMLGWFADGKGEIVALIKPQFEAGRAEMSRCKGVIKDEGLLKKVLSQVLEMAMGIGFSVKGLIPSPITGGDGNREFLCHLIVDARHPQVAVSDLIDSVFGTENS